MAAFTEDGSSGVGILDPLRGRSTRSGGRSMTCRRRFPPHLPTSSNQVTNCSKHNRFSTASSTIHTAGVETAGWPLRGGDAETG